MDFAQKNNKKFKKFNLDDFCEASMWQSSINKSFVSVTFYQGKKLAFHVPSVRHSARSKKYASGGKLDDFFNVSIVNMDSAKIDVSEKGQLQFEYAGFRVISSSKQLRAGEANDDAKQNSAI